MSTYGYSGKPVFITVAATGTYRITAYGAQGGYSLGVIRTLGGYGAKCGNTFGVSAGEHLEIVVGGTGGYGNAAGGGGGGGSFVLGDGTGNGTGNGTYSLLVAAGGGGGGFYNLSILRSIPGGAAGYTGIGLGNGGGSRAGAMLSGGGGSGYVSAGTNGYGVYSGVGGGQGGSNRTGGYAGGAAGGTGLQGSNGGGHGGFGGGGGGAAYGAGGGGGFDGGTAGAGYGAYGDGGNIGDAGGGGGTSIAFSLAGVSVAGSAKTENLAHDANGLVIISQACYLTGTLIRATGGEVAVQDLRIGDLVVTASGRTRPIKWIGHRAYSARFARNNPDLLPICFKAGCIAENVPARDLWVSQTHAMFLDGVLIPAENLVNGVSIVRAEEPRDIEYWHIELDSHDVLLAEGAPSESFVDDFSRGMFQNAASFREIYPDDARVDAIYCAPRVEDGYTLDAVHRRLAERAGIAAVEAQSFGPLRGMLDLCDGVIVEGWAQDETHPDAPVCLDVLVDGRLVALVYAQLFREDLADAGIGDGRHAFSLTLPAPLSRDLAHMVELRRSADGAKVGGLILAGAIAA